MLTISCDLRLYANTSWNCQSIELLNEKIWGRGWAVFVVSTKPNISLVSRAGNRRTIGLKHSKNSKKTTRRTTSAIREYLRGWTTLYLLINRAEFWKNKTKRNKLLPWSVLLAFEPSNKENSFAPPSFTKSLRNVLHSTFCVTTDNNGELQYISLQYENKKMFDRNFYIKMYLQISLPFNTFSLRSKIV